MKKKIFYILIILFILIIASIIGTYAIYVDKYDTNSVFNIAKFKVVVNNEDITLASSKYFEINNITYKKSEDSNLSEANNKLAPGMIGETVISIDTSDVDVAFTYDLSLDLSQFDNEAIVIKYVKVNDTDLALIDNMYHGEVSLDQVMNDEVIDILVGIEWVDINDDESDQLFNEKNDFMMNIPVEIKVKQKME